MCHNAQDRAGSLSVHFKFLAGCDGGTSTKWRLPVSVPWLCRIGPGDAEAGDSDRRRRWMFSEALTESNSHSGLTATPL